MCSSDLLASIRQDPYPRTLIKRDPQAPIVPISTDLSLFCLSIWVCLCVGVFVSLFFFSKCISVLIFLCRCVCVWVCLCASEEKEEDKERGSY